MKVLTSLKNISTDIGWIEWATIVTIVAILAIFTGAIHAGWKEQERFITHCQQQDARLTEEDCYWEYKKHYKKGTTTVMPVVIPAIR